MQNVSDNEGKHIITANNVHKRLSFRGREKFVEVFSQGRNNYRWAELSQIIASPADQAISWSSSDDECDEAAAQLQRGRHLPNRTLSSQINFSDCKLVRRRGRRHSSAQFVRSIEKRPRERPEKYGDTSLAENIIDIKPSTISAHASDTVSEKNCSVIGVELTEEHIWDNNLSILNQTVNLSPDCSKNLSFAAEKLDLSQPSPKGTKTSEIEATSPILVSRVSRIRRKRPTDKNESKPEEESDPVCASKAIPTSPVFKISRPKRGRIKKNDPLKFENESRYKRKELDSPLRNVFLHDATVDPRLTLSPNNPNKSLETPVSPVIGKTVKRQKRMIVDKDMSPILGCKKRHRPIKLPKVTSSVDIKSDHKDSDGIISSLLREDKTVCEPSVKSTSLFNEAQLFVDEEESQLFNSPCIATAKRSLDFSCQNNLNIDCDNSKSQAEQFREDQPFTSSDSLGNSRIKSDCDESSAQIVEAQEKNPLAFNLVLNKSDLIEDANTENIDVVYTVKTSFQKKQSKLSLSKKSPPKNCYAKRPVIPTAQSRVTFLPQTPLTLKNSASDDAEIDSCSSQSPDGTQQDEIEGLPSSAVSTLVGISQASSPLGLVTGNLPAEKSADDFNAPPKKGKTKLKPDGLANRLQRLLSRQRSSSRIWQFKRSKQFKATSALDQGTSMLLAVDKTWAEYSHIVVQGHVLNGTARAARYADAFSDQVIVVLDPTITDKLEKIMSSPKIHLFPPWQSLKLKGISVILCAYCIEIIPSECPNSKLKSLEMGTENSPPLEEGSECVSAINLCDIIFPKPNSQTHHLVQYTEAASQETHAENAESALTTATGSISSLVSHHYIGGATSDTLTLTILRAFQFRPLDLETGQSSDSPSWSLLGQDILGEVCEVLLGSEKSQSLNNNIWQGVLSGEVIGKTFCFSGFLPIQRIAPFRVSNLWKIISSMEILGLCDQPVFYVLSSANLHWGCSLSETQRKTPLHQPTFSQLSSILSEITNEPRRVNIFCSILHATKERLYITDLETSPSITVITVNPTAYLPNFVFKAAVLVFLDLEVAVDELRIDKYSKVSRDDVSVVLNRNLINEEQLRGLASINPSLPLLHRDTSAKTLAMFFGTVVGVDEETAYMWPACGICENELLSLGDGTENYRCENCNDQCDNFTRHMSLQVLCTCPNLPSTSFIRIKLHQSTIESLLPPNLCNEEGYDMNSVIGQQLGPLRCEVLHSKDGNFTLQELPKVQ